MKTMKKILLFAIFLIFYFTNYSQQHFPDSKKDGKYVMVNGAKLWVVLVGKGDPLFIIPGGPGGAHISYRSFDPLATHNMIVYFDAFGRGKSDTAKNVKE